jgi:DNA-binding PadR family transcriptional regulator
MPWKILGEKMFGPRGKYMHGEMHHMHSMRGFGLKYWILGIASENEVTGADIANKIGEITRGNWVPSPGIIYPTLTSLFNDNYLQLSEKDNKKYYKTTEEGKKLLSDSYFPWDEISGKKNDLDDIIVQMDNYSQYLLDNMEKLNVDEKQKIKGIADNLNKIN